MARSFTAASSQRLDLGTASALNITGDITVAGWIKTTSTASQVIMGCYDSSSPFSGWGIGTSVLSADGLLYYWSSGIGTWQTSSGTINSGAWTHVAIRISGTGAGAGTFFINGSTSGTWSHTAPGSYAGNKFIASVGGLAYLTAELAEWSVWNAAKANDEIAILGDGFSPLMITASNRIAYWPLFGRQSPEPDNWGRIDATLTNTPPQAAHPRIIYPRKPQLVFHPAAAPAATARTLTLLGVGM